MLFFFSFSPILIPSEYTCIGMSLELWSKLYSLKYDFPNLADHVYLVSCEENVESMEDYIGRSYTMDDTLDDLEIEHVLLALQFEIDGRFGILLCDPGYHNGRVITIMFDKLYPHTGRTFFKKRVGKLLHRFL